MKLNGIKDLLDRYYSGDISPDDYEILLSTLKECGELTPDLEMERRMLLAVQSCEPVMPEGLEKRLELAIDRRSKRFGRIMKILFTGVAAASVLLCVYVASLRNVGEIPLDSSLVAEVTIVQGTVEEATSEKLADSAEKIHTAKPISTAQPPQVVNEMSDEELERAAQIVDDALLAVLSSISKSQEEAVKSVESIKIDQESFF